MQRREHTHPGCSVFGKLRRQLAVDLPGKAGVGKFCLGGEGVGIQPFEQRQIHAHAQHGILGRVQVHIGEGLQNQIAAAVLHGATGKLRRQCLIHALNDAVHSHQIAVFGDVQFTQRGSGDDGSFENGCFHK